MVLKVIKDNVFNRNYSVGDYLYLPSGEDITWEEQKKYVGQHIMVINNQGRVINVLADDVEEVVEVEDLKDALRKFFLDNGIFKVRVVRKLERDDTYGIGDIMLVRDENIKNEVDLAMAKEDDWVVCQNAYGCEIIVLAGEVEPV